ncbi:MAG: hypothetical protein M1819_005925 [Sarea resinae]|nr:MAG: hypothetical protein M1819_005925 [Sarea resinae]
MYGRQHPRRARRGVDDNAAPRSRTGEGRMPPLHRRDRLRFSSSDEEGYADLDDDSDQPHDPDDDSEEDARRRQRIYGGINDLQLHPVYGPPGYPPLHAHRGPGPEDFRSIRQRRGALEFEPLDFLNLLNRLSIPEVVEELRTRGYTGWDDHRLPPWLLPRLEEQYGP